MIFLPDTNACISLLRQRSPAYVSRWQSTKSTDIVLCSVVIYELRFGAERSSNPVREHEKLNLFLKPFLSLPFDDACAHRCAQIRANLGKAGVVIGPHDLQIASIALEHDLVLVTHNTREFSRISALKLVDWEMYLNFANERRARVSPPL